MSDSNAQSNSGKPYVVEFLGTSDVNGMPMETWEVVHAPSRIVQCAVFFRSDHAEEGGGFETRSKVADRIAACLNACDGINPEAVPELVKACGGLLDAIHDSMTHESQKFHSDQIAAARAAISKAKGGEA